MSHFLDRLTYFRRQRDTFSDGHGITTDVMGNEKPIAPPTNSALEREVEELRERVKVLERIATEDRETKRLSAEIESLREK